MTASEWFENDGVDFDDNVDGSQACLGDIVEKEIEMAEEVGVKLDYDDVMSYVKIAWIRHCYRSPEANVRGF